MKYNHLIIFHNFKVLNGIRPDFRFPIANSYKRLIESCWKQIPSERPVFEQIVNRLKEDKGFITELVDEATFLDYIDEFKTKFSESKSPFRNESQDIREKSKND